MRQQGKRPRSTRAPRRAALVAASSLLGALELGTASVAFAQADLIRPQLRVGTSESGIRVDGRLDESAWARADSIELVQVEPHEGARAAGRTVVRVLATSDAIVVGVR